MQHVQRSGIKIDCFGDGWENGRVAYKEMKTLFKSAKISLNISNSLSYDVRYIFSKPSNTISYLKQSLMKGSKINSQIKARNFEIPAFGGFELTDYVPFLEEYFDIGHEVSCYSNVDECISLLKHWLKYDEEREFIRKRGEKKALNKNLYENRIQEIFAILK